MCRPRNAPPRAAVVRPAAAVQHPPPALRPFFSPQDSPAVLHIHPVPVAVEERGVDQSLQKLPGYMHTILFKPNPPWGQDRNGIPQGFLRITFQSLKGVRLSHHMILMALVCQV